MDLLIVTQKVDKKDENLGFFHRWIEEFSKHFSRVVVIANEVQDYTLPPNVLVYSLGKEKKHSRAKRIYRFFELFSHHYARTDAAFFHMIPEFVVLASPFLISLKKNTALWYVHKSVPPVLKIAERLVRFVFTASALSFRLPSKKVIYTGHAIDTQTFRPGEKNDRTKILQMLSVGRISPVKDCETILLACKQLRHSWSEPWTLSFFGGPLLDRDRDYLLTLKNMSRKNGLDGLVSFEGPRPYIEVPRLYESHDLFLSMSTTGSIDKSVLEAMASGLPVLTANEAFCQLLPPPYFLDRRSPELLAERIKIVSAESKPNLKLRELVEAQHSLKKTIEKIANTLKSPMPKK